jgi:hypothetical protein
MSEPARELARREGDALSQIVGTGDTRAALAVLERNVRDVIDVCRARGFVTTFTDQGNRRDFYGFPAWQLLGMTYGVTPVVEWTQQIDGGWKARAIAQTREGQTVGAAEAVCLRKESSSKQRATDHTLLAMASTRAQRNALRSAFGAALVLAGFDFADPDAPLTNEQRKALFALEAELGLTHEQGHADAGVESYSDLTREEAALLIDRWSAERQRVDVQVSDEGTDNPEPERGGAGGEPTSDKGKVAVSSPAPSDDAPASATAWERATKAGLTSRKALAIAKGLGYELASAADLTGGQLAKVLARFKDRSDSDA